MKPVRIASDVTFDSAVERNILVSASSGQGKSNLLRLILERTKGRIQQIVIDDEGEFPTLREVGDYLIVGGDGDLAIDVEAAQTLAWRVMELGADVVIDLSDEAPSLRQVFVRDFILALKALPREMWHDHLVVLDEAHKFAPETGQGVLTVIIIDPKTGKKVVTAAAREAVIEYAATCRKRGGRMVVATQRPAKLSKSVTAECKSRALGGQNDPDDRKRVIEEMGGAEDRRAVSKQLFSLAAGEFYVVGPAFDVKEARLVRVDVAKTKEPPRGEFYRPPPLAGAGVAKILEQLKDYPQRSKQQRSEVANLREQVQQLRVDLARQRAVTPEVRVERVEVRVPYVPPEALDALQALSNQLAARVEALRVQETEAVVGAALKEPRLLKPVLAARPTSPPRRAVDVTVDESANGIGGPHRAILTAIARLHALGVDQPSKEQVAAWAGYSPGGGAFNNPLGNLRSRGLVTKPGFALTPEGHAVIGTPDPMTQGELHAQVLGMLPGPHVRILRILLGMYPNEVTKAALADAAGYEVNGGAFANPLGRLRTMGLVQYPRQGVVKAASILFVEGS